MVFGKVASAATFFYVVFECVVDLTLASEMFAQVIVVVHVLVLYAHGVVYIDFCRRVLVGNYTMCPGCAKVGVYLVGFVEAAQVGVEIEDLFPICQFCEHRFEVKHVFGDRA